MEKAAHSEGSYPETGTGLKRWFHPSRRVETIVSLVVIIMLGITFVVGCCWCYQEARRWRAATLHANRIRLFSNHARVLHVLI
jgi:hypothetical protein